MHSDKELLDIYIEMQKDLKPTLSIEVGAFDADYSKAMAKLGIECFAFEASPFIYNRFKNDMEGISYINKAVSDKNETIQFQLIAHQDPNKIGHNSIKNRNEDLNYLYVDVESITLNSYFKDRSDERICLWIDCEGANKEVLLGATNILPSVSTILIETEDIDFWKDQWLHEDVVRFLSLFGFEVLEERPSLIKQRNVIFKKRGL
jgi:FkbM family methyltransferase